MAVAVSKRKVRPEHEVCSNCYNGDDNNGQFGPCPNCSKTQLPILTQVQIHEKAREIRRAGGTPAWICSCERVGNEISQRAHLAQLRRRGTLGSHRTVSVSNEPLPVKVRRPAHNDSGQMLALPGLLEISEKKLRELIEKTEFPPLSEWVTACWYWKGWRNKSGYGRLFIRHHRAKGERALNAYVHRLWHTIFRGPIGGLELDHDAVCGHEWCVNPWHTEKVDHPTNLDRRDEANGQGKYAEDPHEIPF